VERVADGGARPLASRGEATVARKLSFSKRYWKHFSLVASLTQVESESPA